MTNKEQDYYLPDILRDFHDQKEVFKEIHKKWNRDDTGFGDMGELPWITAHIYTVDYFLKYMAEKGYRLQKNRARKNKKE